eukprot:14457559-Ditylum_brightwellii.AAC.1
MASQTQPREVNSSMTRLPACVYTDQTGCQFQVNAIQYLQITNPEVEGNKELCLIDDSSNNGLAGPRMRLYEMAEHPERVDIIGANDDIQDGMKSLPISTYCAVVTSATCKHCLEGEEELKDDEFWTPEMKKPWDYDALCPYFAWKSVKVIKHTMAATTQYAKNVMHLPMRRHIKSCFPALC